MAQKKEVKIFCIGANLESYECLKYLVEKGCTLHTLITLPRGQNKNVSDYVDLHDFCTSHGINVIDTTSVNDVTTIDEVKALKPDYLFTLGWSQIFGEGFIGCFSKFIIGTHPTKLPYGRGRAPLPWTIIEGQTESAVSFFKIDTGVDTGMLIAQRPFTIAKNAYVKELYTTVGMELAQGFLEIYQTIVSNTPFRFTRQNEEGATVRGKRTPSDGFIDFNRPVQDIERLIRAVSEPYPGAYCYYSDQKIIFWEVEFDRQSTYSGTLGQILKRSSNGVLVRFSDGNLWLNRPTDANGKALNLTFFRVGNKLGYNIEDEIYQLKNKS